MAENLKVNEVVYPEVDAINVLNAEGEEVVYHPALPVITDVTIEMIARGDEY